VGIKAFPAVSVDIKFVSFVNLKCKCKIFVGKGHQISPGPLRQSMQPHYCCRGCDTPTGCPLRLEKLEALENLENEPFSEFGWNSFKAIGFSPSLAGKDGILF